MALRRKIPVKKEEETYEEEYEQDEEDDEITDEDLTFEKIPKKEKPRPSKPKAKEESDNQLTRDEIYALANHHLMKAYQYFQYLQ